MKRKLKFCLFSKYCLLILFAVSGSLLLSCEEDPPINKPDDEEENQPDIQALSDGDFENWTLHVEGEVSYEVPASEWWGSLNMLSTIGGPLTMIKSEDSHSGDFAVQLETMSWGDELSIPGIIAAGYFDPNQPMAENLMLGRPFTGQPIALTGYYKYLPVDQDTMALYTNLTRYNTETNTRDTIAEATLTSDEITDTYTKFELFYDYFETDIAPDTINVLFLTSISGQNFLGHIGSRLLIDDVSLLMPNED